MQYKILNFVCGKITFTQEQGMMAQRGRRCINKVECTLVQALRLCTGRTADRGSRGIALLYRH